METRANYVAIGGFVVMVLLGALGSLLWLYRSSEPGQQAFIRVVFPEPVTGLSVGGSVLFNGIRVGEVTQLQWQPQGGDDVIALARVTQNAPIKPDTEAKLSSTGLTGVSFISLTGGDPDAAPIFADLDEGDVPTLRAATSDFTSVLDSAQSVLAQINVTLGEVNGILRDNRGDVRSVITNARVLSDSLAQSAPAIEQLVTDASSAARELSEALPGARRAIDRADTLLAAVPPAAVSQIVGDVSTFASTLPSIGEEAQVIAGTVGGVVNRIDSAAGTLGEALSGVRQVVSAVSPDLVGELVADAGAAMQGFADLSGSLAGVREEAAQTVRNANTLTADLATAAAGAPGLVENLNGRVSDLGGVIQAVDAEAVNSLVQSADRAAQGLAAEVERAGPLITAATTAAQNIADVSGSLAEVREEAAQTVRNANTISGDLAIAAARTPDVVENLNGRITDVGGIITAIDAAAINSLIGNADQAAAGLAAQVERTGPLITAATAAALNIADVSGGLAEVRDDAVQTVRNANALTADLASAAAGAPQVVENLNGRIADAGAVIRALDADAINRLVGNADRAAAGLATEIARLEPLVTAATGAAENIALTAALIQSRSPAIGSTLDDVAAAASSARQAAAGLPGLVETLEPGVANLSEVFASVDPAAVQSLVNDASAFAGTLAENREAIAQIAQRAAGAAERIEAIAAAFQLDLPEVSQLIADARVFAGNLTGLVEQLQPGLENVSAALTSFVPQRVGEAVDGVATFATGLSERTGAVGQLIDDAGAFASGLAAQAPSISELVGSARSLATRLDGLSEEVSPQVSALVDNARQAVQAAEEFARQLPGFGQTLEPGIQNMSALLSEIDRTAVRAIVADSATVASGLADQMEPLAETLTAARATAQSASALSAALAERAPQITGIIDTTEAGVEAAARAAADAEGTLAAVRPNVESAAAAVAVITPERVEKIANDVQLILDGVIVQSDRFGTIMLNAEAVSADARTIASAVAGRSEVIVAAIDDTRAAIADLRAASQQVPLIVTDLQPGLENFGNALEAIDTDAVGAIVADAARTASAVATEAERLPALVTRAESTLAQADAAAANAVNITAALATETEEIGQIVANANAASADARAFASRLPALADTLEPGIANVSEVLQAVDPEAVRTIVADVGALSAALAAEAPRVSQIVDDLGATAGDVRATASTIRGELSNITSLLSNAEAAAADARLFAAGLTPLLADLRPGVNNLSTTLQSVDPAAIEAIIGNLRATLDTIADNREAIAGVIGSAQRAAANVERVSATIGARSATIGAAIDDARRLTATLADASPRVTNVLEAVDETAQQLRQTIGAVDPAEVRAIVADVRAATRAVGERADDIRQAIDNAVNAAQGLAQSLGSIDGEKGEFSDILDRARILVRNLEGASQNVSVVAARAAELFSGPVQSFVASADNAAVQVGDVAEAFSSRADAIAGGLARFSTGGLDDLRGVLAQGRTTLAAIESTVNSIERNPSRVIFGGSDGPRYTPQRR